MTLTIFSLLWLAPGLIILGWSSLSLFAYAHALESRLFFEREDPPRLRLVKAGLDAAYGGLPATTWFFWQLLGGEAAPAKMPSIALMLGLTFGYLLAYYGFIRPQVARYRAAKRAGHEAGSS